MIQAGQLIVVIYRKFDLTHNYNMVPLSYACAPRMPRQQLLSLFDTDLLILMIDPK